jgi:hypothetical protein
MVHPNRSAAAARRSGMTDDEVPGWVRLGMVIAIGVPQLLIGLWAVIDPSGWFEHFPGFDPRLVAAYQPYNEHLATDAGSGFVCTGVALCLAAALGKRSGVLVALATMAAFGIPHLAYHVSHPSDLLTSGEDALGAVALAVPLVLCAVFAFGTLRGASGGGQRRLEVSDDGSSPATPR